MLGEKKVWTDSDVDEMIGDVGMAVRNAVKEKLEEKTSKSFSREILYNVEIAIAQAIVDCKKPALYRYFKADK